MNKKILIRLACIVVAAVILTILTWLTRPKDFTRVTIIPGLRKEEIAAINAALNPASTTCLYYIHDLSRNIHCSDTFAEQKENTLKYLR